MIPRSLVRLRKTCLALPEAHEVMAWGEPTFRIRNKMFAMYASASNHHGAGRAAVWIKSSHEDQQRLVRAAPLCFFVPPYMGPSGWIGVWLDSDCDWKEVAAFVSDGYRLVAPKKVLDALDRSEPTGRKATAPKARRKSRPSRTDRPRQA